METNKVYQGNNIDVLKTFPDNSIDSIVTDPPYGINFMGKKWDYDVPSVDTWKEVYRVLKPGGHILVACGTRTQHRMAVNIEDAGFEIRDIVAWIYGSGFPKSLDIAKSIEGKLVHGSGNTQAFSKLSGETKNVKQGYIKMQVANGARPREMQSGKSIINPEFTTEEAKQWQGWGTALKPSAELWTLARKPFNTSVAENVLKYGTGGINIDGCRIGNEERHLEPATAKKGTFNCSFDNNYQGKDVCGRFPANLIHDGSDEVVALFPNDGEQSAARFFYTSKAQQSERDMGLYGFEEGTTDDGRKKSIDNAFQRGKTKRRNVHPTVKPLDLMRYLCRLITPPNGICLDPYLGSGTTAVAAKLEDFQYIGIEMEEEYCKIAEARIAECDKDYKTKAEALKDDHVAEIYDIFDFMKGDDSK